MTARRKTEKVVGNIRVSTEEQASSGLGLAAQREVIEAECARRGWELVAVHEDAGASGSTLRRPALSEALEALRSHQADALVVVKLDRLSRSLLDFVGLMAQARKEGWAMVALDLGVDTTTPSGEMIANVMASFAQFERRLISVRTSEALAQKKRQGARLGRPVAVGKDVARRITRERKKGRSLREIADGLNHDGPGHRSWRQALARLDGEGAAGPKLTGLLDQQGEQAKRKAAKSLHVPFASDLP